MTSRRGPAQPLAGNGWWHGRSDVTRHYGLGLAHPPRWPGSRLGDRQICWARHVIAVRWMRSHPPILACMQRRRAEGRTGKEIRRCIKRDLARHPCRALARVGIRRSVIVSTEGSKARGRVRVSGSCNTLRRTGYWRPWQCLRVALHKRWRYDQPSCERGCKFVSFQSVSRLGRGRMMWLAIPVTLLLGLTWLSVQGPPLQPPGKNPRASGQPKRCPSCDHVVKPDRRGRYICSLCGQRFNATQAEDYA